MKKPPQKKKQVLKVMEVGHLKKSEVIGIICDACKAGRGAVPQ